MSMTSRKNDFYLSDADAQTVRNALTQAKNILKPYFIDLTEDEKKGRNMAEGREGLVRLVSKIAVSHEESLARNDNAKDLTLKLDFDARLELLRQDMLTVMEIITETQLANGIVTMNISDRFIKTLQAGRDNDAGLDLAMREVDEWNQRFANTTPKNTETTEPEKEA